MAGNDWKAPFLELRQKITALYSGGHRVYHRLVASTVTDPISHCSVRDNLAVELPCETVQRRVEVTTPGLAAHCHVFYSPTSNAIEQLSSSLQGLRRIVSAIPTHAVPAIRVPKGHLAEARFEVRPDLEEIRFSEGGPKAWFCVIRRSE